MKDLLLARYQSKLLPGPLNGKIVLGFCYYVSGPITLQNLVAQGALVIKIERKPVGDPSRYVFSPAIFNSLSHSELSVAIDYDNASDVKLLGELFKIADVIVDNRSVRAKKNDKLLVNYLESVPKPGPVVYCAIDGFPDAEANPMPGLDASAQACTGLAYTNCFTRDNPIKVGAPILDIMTGLLAANYILANLLYLSQPNNALPSSAKQVIRVALSLVGTSVWLQTNQILDAMGGNEYFRDGNKDRYAAPFSYYKTKNGLLSVATVNETQFEKFCHRVLQNKDFHDRYPVTRQRIENQDAFENELNAILQNENREYWLEKCQEHDIPAAPVLTVSESLQQDFIKSVIVSGEHGPVITNGASHSLFGKMRYPDAAPTVGQDNHNLQSIFSLGQGA